MRPCQSEYVGRRRSLVIVTAGLMLGFVATGSINEQRATAGVRSSSQAAAHERVIVTFGDSLTAGVAGRSYPNYLQDLLNEHGYPYRIDNQGVSGDTTSDGLARIDNVIAVHPALVILEFGGNDGLRGLPVDSIRETSGRDDRAPEAGEYTGGACRHYTTAKLRPGLRSPVYDDVSGIGQEVPFATAAFPISACISASGDDAAGRSASEWRRQQNTGAGCLRVDQAAAYKR